MGVRDRFGRTADEDALQIRKIVQMLGDTLQALGIDERDLRA